MDSEMLRKFKELEHELEKGGTCKFFVNIVNLFSVDR